MTPPDSTEAEPAWICLGSNIRPRENLPLAVSWLAEAASVVAVSRVWASAAKGAGPDAPGFLNAAVEIRTRLEPLEVKYELLRPLEAALGRVRTDDPNAPRTIDLDLCLMGSRVLDAAEDGLVLPDPDVLSCAHVALPLADLAPDLCHPVTGEPLARIAAALAATVAIRVVDTPRLTPPGSVAPTP